ncbi:ABC transporter substrate-binding protein [Streptomyces rubellomurinus]|uniref:ABC transporter substrate-binding protein n=2 Tax=Streptomyces TaxID=1883 RepID=A0A0F2TIN4_STRR3|nr:extracellular solute-binding protein [Streptomyces rubellomurinus]KJS55029.1 ABC transporter substrate-binding protein [Streptomyces rubellomurinus subsp. indigoferus]KJS63009.1 ABC transporter substrate-binding protein [Streptomyces rubellomurinus]
MSHLSRRDLLRASGAGLLALAAGGALAACDSASGGASGGDADTGTVTVWSWATAALALRGVVPAFEKDNPGIKVDVQDIGNPAIWDKITVGLAAGGQGLGDVLHIGCDYLPGYLEKFPGGLADLSAFGADAHRDKFAKGLWPVVTGKDGHAYALPWEANPLGFFYRKDCFDKAGIDPTTFATWDDLIAVADRFKAANPGISLLGINKAANPDPDLDFVQNLMQLQGAFYFDLQGKITLGSEPAARALTVLKRLDDTGLVADAPGAHGWADLMKTGKLAVAPMPSWAAHYLEAKFADQSGTWRLTKPPAVTPGGKRAALVNSTHLAVAASSPRRRAAWKFVEYALTRPASVNSMFTAGGVFPALTTAYADPMYAAPSAYYGGQSVLKTFADLATDGGDATNFTGDYARALKLASDAQTKVFLKGADPAAVLRDAAKQLAQQTGRTIA